LTAPPLTAQPPPRAHRAQLPRVLFGLLIAVLLLAPVLASLWPRSDPGPAPRGRIMEISAATNALRSTVQLPPPNDIEAGLGAVWVTRTVGARAGVARLESQHDPRRASIELGAPEAVIRDDLAVGEGAVWVVLAEGLFRVDPSLTRQPRRVLAPGRGEVLDGVADGAGAVWVINVTLGTLSRLDPVTGSVTRVVPVGASPNGVEVGGAAVWVTSASSPQVLKISSTGERVLDTVPLRAPASAIAVGAGAVWVAVDTRDAVAKIDIRSSRVEWISVGARPTGLSVTDAAVWVANSGSNTISRIDPRTDEVVATIRVPERPYRIAADSKGVVWVTSLGAPAPHS
jgi:YVTN family beta-propeller protein